MMFFSFVSPTRLLSSVPLYYVLLCGYDTKWEKCVLMKVTFFFFGCRWPE
jgi:hypothetical protein